MKHILEDDQQEEAFFVEVYTTRFYAHAAPVERESE